MELSLNPFFFEIGSVYTHIIDKLALMVMHGTLLRSRKGMDNTRRLVQHVAAVTAHDLLRYVRKKSREDL